MFDKYVLKRRGVYKGKKNITNVLPTLMQEFITIDKNVTLRDIFKMLYKYKNFFSVLFYQHSFKEYVDYALNTKKLKKQEYDKLNVYLSADIDKVKKGFDLYYIWYADGIKKRKSYAIDLCPLEEILDVPIVLGKGVFTDNRYSNPTEITYKSVDTQITLYDLFNCLFNEISFNGLPDEKKEMFNKLKRVVDNIGLKVKSSNIKVGGK